MADAKEAEKERYFQFKEEHGGKLTLQEREQICNELGISQNVTYKWDKQGNGGLQQSLSDMSPQALKGLKKACEAGNAQALRLHFQLTGDLIEKREDRVRFEFTTTDRIRIARETIAGLREQYQHDGGYCPVCQRPQTLPAGTCLDTNKGKATEDSKMATLGLST